MSSSESQATALAAAIAAAFPTREALERVIDHAFGQTLNLQSPDSTLPDLAARLVAAASAQPDGLSRLVAAARDARPDDTALAEVAQRVGLAPEPPAAAAEKGGLEREVDPLSGLMSYPDFLSRATRLQTQVCLIELRGGAWGTGFLVGPNLVLTNYHVAEPLLMKRAEPSVFTLLFDYKQDNTGATVNSGVRYSLADPELARGRKPVSPR